MDAPSEEEDAKHRAQQRFQRILAEVLVEARGESSDSAQASLEALKLAKSAKESPKYFTGNPPRLENVAEIDKVAAEDGASGSGDPETQVRNLYGDMFHLCMALKPRKGQPATAEDPNFDVNLVDRFFSRVPQEAAEQSLETLGSLADSITEQGCGELVKSPAKMRSVLLMFAHTGLKDPESFDVFKKLLKMHAELHANKEAREILVRWYAAMPMEVLERHVGMVQQFLTLTLLEAQGETANSSTLEAVMEIARSGELARHTRNALRILDIFWLANQKRIAHRDNWRTRRKAQLLRQRGELLDEEETNCLNTAQFHNDAINECEGILKHDLKEVLEVQHRGQHFPHPEDKQRSDFGVIEFPFVLTAVSKVRMLNIESLLMQREEVRHAMAWQMMLRSRGSMNPFLVLKVRRNAVIEDALQQLAIYGSQHFKKPLKVVFDGEEAVDEGGVQKEFFQLLIEELYNEDFGMFERIDESRNFWFNKNSFEVNLQFELFGIVLGLAIYNQVILDVKFPMAVYKKLMLGPQASLGLSDLLDFQPSLAQGLIALLEHNDTGANFEDVFGPLRFVVEYECFGSMVEAELMEGGVGIPVTWENREDYVQRYCDWIFTKGVERQYGAFRKGFDQCIGDTLFRQLFRHDELELVICGSMEFDFRALEGGTQYQDGFTESSDAVRWFWEVVHSLTVEEKRNLLQFCTGCDRAPVGGLGRLPFIVSRAGPDSEMLPWVHTCFNHLLLPAYSSKEKLEQRLRLAIQHSTGFGLM